MLDFIKTKRNYILAIAVLFVFISLSETTYSLFLTSNTTDELGYNTGLLDLQFKEDDLITLNNTFPTADSDAINNNTYNLTIKNIGNISYLFNLKMINTETSDNSISDKYIKVKVNDNIPINLYNKNNIITEDMLINPGEEITFKINVWLDIDTPNSELGKSYKAKIITSGSSFYKTIDKSGANTPILKDGMIPVSYSNSLSSWITTDKTNTNKNNYWYNYDNSEWANSVILKDSNKKIYDITRNNDLNINNVKYNNGNLIIEDKSLDIGLANYNDAAISNIIRFKVGEDQQEIYLITNGSISYYYDNITKAFVFKTKNKTVTAGYTIDSNTWYLAGYTYDGSQVSFYVNGTKISTMDITGNINSSNTFKVGTDETFKKVSHVIIGDILVYNRILSDNEINNNYQSSINVITNGLLEGYTEFIPMTLKEYYMSRNEDVIIKEEDIQEQYVWIPSYKYRLWNIMGDITDTYDAYHKGIDIVFENGKTSTGNIYCEKDACYSDLEHTNQVTSLDNDKYYTPLAFTKEELTGFWVSKYEYSQGTYDEISKVNNAITDTMWSSIAYLSHSKYGLCKNNTCQDIKDDTTTNNIYGVYDMYGSLNEYAKIDDTYYLGKATKEIKTQNGLWYDNQEVLDNPNTHLIRGGNTESGNIFTITEIPKDSDTNLTTRLIIK